MAEQTSLVAQQVRLMHWAEQIRECQNRLEGMDVSTWCEQNNITKANYYYRLKRVRQMCLDQLPEAEKPAFFELSRLKAERTATVPEVPVMCIKNGHGLSANLFSSVPPQLLRCLVGHLVMLNDAAVSQFKKVYLAPGYTDLRREIDGLASIVRFQFELDPYDKNTLFLFCGRKNSRIKALLVNGRTYDLFSCIYN